MKLPPAATSGRERFLAAVVEHVPVDRVVELYLFQPIRQGGVESGVAVIAAAGDAPLVDASPVQGDAPEQLPAGVNSPGDDSEPRYTVFTARYRHVLKGPDRGHWEVSVVAEADAPLATVGAVVRGVQRRAGDMEAPEHITGGALRDALGQGATDLRADVHRKASEEQRS
jgi:hypothetical protein